MFPFKSTEDFNGKRTTTSVIVSTPDSDKAGIGIPTLRVAVWENDFGLWSGALGLWLKRKLTLYKWPLSYPVSPPFFCAIVKLREHILRTIRNLSYPACPY
jgi:hypothetical protein